MNKDEMKIKGSLNVVIHHANGDVETRHKDNLILNGGFDYICAAMADPTRPAVMGYTAVGTGTHWLRKSSGKRPATLIVPARNSSR